MKTLQVDSRKALYVHGEIKTLNIVSSKALDIHTKIKDIKYYLCKNLSVAQCCLSNISQGHLYHHTFKKEIYY